MPLTAHSKLKEVWRNPVGHQMLQGLMHRQGRNEKWIHRPLIANMPLYKLDRTAGAGFCDAILELAARHPEGLVSAFSQERTWWKEAVAYQVWLPSFMDSDHDGIGDIGGLEQRIPYLEKLGVDTLLLWPLPQGRGGVADYSRIEAEYGDNEDFAALVEKAHARNIRVLMGVDIAATSDEHPWFTSNLEGDPDGTYVLRPGTANVPPNNWTHPQQTPVWTWYPEICCWGLHLGGRHQMDLDWDNPAVRRKIAEMLAVWAGAGVDGFCFTAITQLSKSSYDDGNPALSGRTGLGAEKYTFGPRLHRYLRELKAALPPELMLAGEAKGVSTEMAKLFSPGGGGELDMLLDTSHLGLLNRTRVEDPRLELTQLKAYFLRWMEDYAAEGWMPVLLGTPVTPRIVSRLGASPLYRAILAKLLGTLQLTLRGTPVIYQGDELGLANVRFTSPNELRDPVALGLYQEACERVGEAAAFQLALGHTADHARTPMPWSSGPNAGFTGARPWMRLPDGADYLNVAAQMQDENSVLGHYQKMIALRQKTPAFIYGTFNPVFVKDKRVFCYFRILDGEKWYVEMNLTEREVTRPGRISPLQRLVASNYDAPARALRPYEANVYYCEQKK